MNAPRRILVLHDSPEFGGHERAFLTWLPALLDAPEVEGVVLAFPERNRSFADALGPFAGPKLRLRPGPFAKRPAEPFLAPFRFGYRRWLRALVRQERPQVVLLLQGRIENLCAAILSLPSSRPGHQSSGAPGPELVSYVPMAHSGRELGRPAALAAVTDRVKRFYYGRPARFIAPSHAVAGQLRAAGARGAVHVVRNVPERRPAARRAGSSGAVPLSALFLGRFETRQKGLDLLLRSLELAGRDLDGWTFRFVGDGPDAAWLTARLAALPHLHSRISSWTAEPREALAAAHLVLMPSRFEGVPLVLLEALADRAPVLAAPIDVFREHLPPANLFDFGGPGLAAAMNAAVSPAGREAFEIHARRLDAEMDLQRSREGFVQAVLGFDGAAGRSLEAAE